MRNPIKTMNTVTVQELLDRINEALYAETNDLSVHVALIPDADTLHIAKICYGAIYDEIICTTSSNLINTLWNILYECRFPTHLTEWWDYSKLEIVN